MSAPAPAEPRILFANVPTSEQLRSLWPAPRVRRLRLEHRESCVEVQLGASNIWFLLPGLIWFGLLVLVAPFAAPFFGGDFMDWWRWWGLVAFTWMLLLPGLLLFFAWITSVEHDGESVLIIDPQRATLHLPRHGRVLAADEIDSYVQVFAWQQTRHGLEPVIQTSVVANLPSGEYELLPIVTQVGPSLHDRRLADFLAGAIERTVLRIELETHHENA